MHILAHFNATWLGIYIGDAVAPWHADHLDYPWQQQMPNKIMCSMASQNKGGTKNGGVKRVWVSLQSNSTDVCAFEQMSISV